MTPIKITKRHINKGIASDECECPIALGIRAKVKKGVKVHVHGDAGVSFERGDEFVTRVLPKKAKTFISHFDDEFPVWPIEFSVSIPARFLRA